MSDDGSGATVAFDNGINLQVTSTDNDVMNLLVVVPPKFQGKCFIKCTLYLICGHIQSYCAVVL